MPSAELGISSPGPGRHCRFHGAFGEEWHRQPDGVAATNSEDKIAAMPLLDLSLTGSRGRDSECTYVLAASVLPFPFPLKKSHQRASLAGAGIKAASDVVEKHHVETSRRKLADFGEKVAQAAPV